MKSRYLSTAKDFDRITRIKELTELSPTELEYYYGIFLDRIAEAGVAGREREFFWCPKCETQSACVDIDRKEDRALAVCLHCRIAITVVLADLRR